MDTTPFRLTPADADRYRHLRLRMLMDAPWAYGSSPADDRPLNAPTFADSLTDEQGAILAVATDGDKGPLIASAGILRVTQLKSMHRSKLWGVFVEPVHRGRGLGRAVVAAAIRHAGMWKGVDYIDLGVSENSPGARRLYESFGFRAWGREPESLQCDDRRYDEIFMSLRL
jgi:RimJ/RimL family protein N-acetyltransferase